MNARRGKGVFSPKKEMKIGPWKHEWTRTIIYLFINRKYSLSTENDIKSSDPRASSSPALSPEVNWVRGSTAKCYLIFKNWCLPLTKSIGRSIEKLHFESGPIRMKQTRNQYFIAACQLWHLEQVTEPLCFQYSHSWNGMKMLPCGDDVQMG